MAENQQQIVRKARPMPEREIKDEQLDDGPIVITDDPEEIGNIQTPQQVVEEHKKQIEAAERKFRAESEARQKAEREAHEARQRATTAQGDAYTAQETAISNQIETQTAASQSAQAAYRAARETGNLEDEMKALDALTSAKTALSQLNQQKMYLAALKGQQTQKPTTDTDQSGTRQSTYQGPHGYSQATEDWLAGHPKYDTDSNYRTIVEGAARAAIRDGAVSDTPAFFKYIEDKLSDLYKDPNDVQVAARQQVQRSRPASSQAAPPSRDSGRTSPIEQNGQISATAVARHMGLSLDDLREGARINNMSFENYVREQASIIKEEQGGQNAGFHRDRF